MELGEGAVQVARVTQPLHNISSSSGRRLCPSSSSSSIHNMRGGEAASLEGAAPLVGPLPHTATISPLRPPTATAPSAVACLAPWSCPPCP